MRSADRLVQQGVMLPGLHEPLSDEAEKVWRLYNEGIRDLLSDVPVIVADDVEASIRPLLDEGYVLEDFHSLAPPFPAFWVEFPATPMAGASHRLGPHVRRGFFVTVEDSERAMPTQERSNWIAVERAMAHAEEGGHPRPTWGWVVTFDAYLDDGHRVGGPVGWLTLVLDKRGRVVGNGWAVTPLQSFVRAGLLSEASADRGAAGSGAPLGDRQDDDVLGAWLLTCVRPALQTLALLNCRNVSTAQITPPAKSSRKRVRRGGRPLVNYHVLRVEVPGGPRRYRDVATTGDHNALHVVRGHLAHYGNCCPGTHPPNGRLFGKLEGVYYQPAHVRGTSAEGVAPKDYEVGVRGETA